MNSKTKNARTAKGQLKMVEILHVDTAGSRDLFKELKLSAPEKASCQKLMNESFVNICRKHKGYVQKWDGDGGFAFFFSDVEQGLAVKAGEDFLCHLPTLNVQTAIIIHANEFPRSIRIKAHRGEVFVTNNSSINSAEPRAFDDFLKYEKKLAPKEDDFFITKDLYEALPSISKKRFGEYQKSLSAGSIKTTLYLMKRKPVERTDNIFTRGDELKSITQDDWKYLRNHMVAQKVNIASRNSITMGLARIIQERNTSIRTGSFICSQHIFELTLRGLYNYLRAIDKHHEFSICYWLTHEENGQKYLKMLDFRYPQAASTSSIRKVSISDNDYKVCKAFNNIEPVVTPSVKLAYNVGNWKYFDKPQKKRKRDLQSAIQFPVYVRSGKAMIPKGVLSVDTNKPNFFLEEEIPLLKEELVHYLVNLSLASVLHECENIIKLKEDDNT